MVALYQPSFAVVDVSHACSSSAVENCPLCQQLGGLDEGDPAYVLPDALPMLGKAKHRNWRCCRLVEHPLCLQLEVLEFHDNRSSPFEDSTLLAALLEALGSLRPADGESLAQLLRGFDQVHRSSGRVLRNCGTDVLNERQRNWR